MKHKIDPSVDCVFKAILGNEKYKNLLIHFLNAVLEKPEQEKIEEISILNPYNEREFEDDKLGIADVKARDEMDNNYQVEMQTAIHPCLPPRMLHSWSTFYRSLMKKGENFGILSPVTSVWILKESLFPEADKCHLPFVPWNEEYGIMLGGHFSINVLQLPKWQMNSSGYLEKDRWLYLFKEGWNVDIENPPEILNTEEMRQVMGILKDFSENQKNYLLYQKRLEAEYLRNTWEAEIEKERKKKEKERKKKDRALKEKDREREEKERALKDNERLLLLLKKAGVDPDQTAH
ncbi:MAG: Rpn family recombination-promoting nuclease/putative transposase [Desulfobacterales bacterium]|nr:Rpn family recombination-promoting nuclease/putative transposase [Desulfobacterales bacterium]